MFQTNFGLIKDGARERTYLQAFMYYTDGSEV